MNRLVLFCGGPAIYPGGVPKPLQVVDGERTLLELYFDTPFTAGYSDITLLCEGHHAAAFRAVARRSRLGSDVQVVETPNDSSTLTKLSIYLQSPPAERDPVTFTYPDIFYFGHLAEREDAVWSERIVLSLRTLSSRFPQITKEPFADRVRSISNHKSAVPANPVYLFGGHLVATPNLLRRILDSVGRDVPLDAMSLEFDLVAEMISEGTVQSELMSGLWLQADSPRDIWHIMTAMSEHGQFRSSESQLVAEDLAPPR